MRNSIRIILLCGRYEGVDERVAEHLATDELSIGDFVLSGGELGAALIVDAVTRLIPGALGNEDSTVNESFSAAADFGDGEVQITGHGSPYASAQGKRVTNHVLLDCPHYTRPAEFRGWNVPEVLLGGNHEEIRRWRLQKALEKTRRNRPDLLGILSPGLKTQTQRATPNPFHKANWDGLLVAQASSLWGFVLASTKTHRLKPVPLQCAAPGYGCTTESSSSGS